MRITELERRWAADGLGVVAGPEAGTGVSPGQFAKVFALASGAMGPKAALGLRVALWWLAWSPVWLGIACVHVSALKPDGRRRVASGLAGLRGSLSLSLLSLLKMVAAMTIFQSAARRERSGYGRSRRQLTLYEGPS